MKFYVPKGTVSAMQSEFQAVFGYFGGGLGSEKYFGVSIFRSKTFIFKALTYLALSMLTQFRVILGLLGLYLGYFGVKVKSKNCFGVSSYRLSTLIFYACL